MGYNVQDCDTQSGGWVAESVRLDPTRGGIGLRKEWDRIPQSVGLGHTNWGLGSQKLEEKVTAIYGNGTTLFSFSA